MLQSQPRYALGLMADYKASFAVIEFDHRIWTEGNCTQEDDNPVVNRVLCEDGVGRDE